MASDNSDKSPAPADRRAADLADEVRQLKMLLVDLQAELRPAVQSSLRERSEELQRLGGELAEREDSLQRLRAEAQAAKDRSEDLEREVERWRDAARRGVHEVSEKARAAAERYEQQAAELSHSLSAVRQQLETSRTQARDIAMARDAALKEAERRRARARVLSSRVLRREAQRVAMKKSLSWRITAPLRIAEMLPRWMLALARLRRRLTKR